MYSSALLEWRANRMVGHVVIEKAIAKAYADLREELIPLAKKIAKVREASPRHAAEYVRSADSALRAADESNAMSIAAASPGEQGPHPRLGSSGAESPQSTNAGQLPVRRRPGQLERLNKQIADQLTERHGIQVYGFNRPGIDTGTVRDIVRAVDDMLAKYPHARILSMEIGDVEGDIARAFEDRLPNTDLIGTRIAFSEKYATDPERLAEDVAKAVERRHFAPRAERPAYSTIVHEFGHALTFEGRSAAVERADSHLLDHYHRTYGHDNPGGDLAQSYENWRGQLSGYSFWKGGDFHPTEALAEAFADVELNGARASEPAQVLHKILVDTAESRWRKEGLL